MHPRAGAPRSPGLSSLPLRLLDARAGHLALHRALHIVRDESLGRETLPGLALGAWSRTPSTASARLPHGHAPASAQRSWPLWARREDSKAVLYFLTSLPASIKILQYRLVKPRGFIHHCLRLERRQLLELSVVLRPLLQAKAGVTDAPGPSQEQMAGRKERAALGWSPLCV